MKAGKKYVRSDGIQYAMYPNSIMNITQSINGAYSHRGTNAIDDAQENTGISNGYAPCDMVCVATDYVNGNAMFWQSQKPVVTRKYGVTYIYLMVIHDNTANAYIGMKIKQGEQLFSEGTAGMATGNHNHIEVGIGKFKGTYILNAYGVYMMPGNVNPADVFFVDDTKIINGGGLNWGKIPKEPSQPSEKDLIQEDGIATMTADSVQARLNGPKGNVVRKYNSGDKIRYYWKWVGNGHRYIVWKEGKNYIYLAVSGSETPGKDPWATFSAPDDTNATPENPELPDVTPNDLIQEDGIATLTVDGVRARLNNPNGSIVRTYNTADKIRYYWKWIGNGHRYIVWKENNEYIYLAVSGSEEQGKDSWATFSAPDENNEEKPSTPSYDDLYDPEEEPNLKDEIIDIEEFAKYGLKAKVQLVDRRLYKSKCCYTMENPKGIGIHNFGASSGSPTAQNSADGQNKEDMNPSSLKSWHFQVDDKEIIQSLPMNRNSFSFGDGAKGEGNRNYIAIEIMKDMPTDDREAADKAQDNGALAAAIICYKKGWDVKDLKKHQDFKMTDGSYKYCPHRILDNGWDNFIKQVQIHYDRIVEINSPKDPETGENNTDTSDNNNNEELNIGLINKLIRKLIQLINKILNNMK